jgi:hypothetical protein
MVLTMLLLFGPYEIQQLQGWTLHVEKAVLRQNVTWQKVKNELDSQLYRIIRSVPGGPLQKLRKIPIWIHWEAQTPCMAYHPSKEWLQEHKYNPDMAKGVEIGNCKNFLSWTGQQPWMIMHELAHGYHDRFLDGGFDNKEVKSAYDHMMEGQLFESVRHWNGGMEKHYATTNPMEYFAEETEAYFGQNDFFPFVYAELKNADPMGFELQKEIWGKSLNIP